MENLETVWFYLYCIVGYERTGIINNYPKSCLQSPAMMTKSMQTFKLNNQLEEDKTEIVVGKEAVREIKYPLL